MVDSTETVRGWCEFCRDHYDRGHFNTDGMHGIGHEFGPYGALLADADTLRKARRLAIRVTTAMLMAPADNAADLPALLDLLTADARRKD